ncbi:MAG: U32 family peptidase [Fibromonadaceae bacterium]|jgi:putative protease|nr:U32 family peptidase [Fibromonadaceae bacterium]
MAELLSPVASFEMCKAAVQNGANAIYAGVPNFNARRHGTSLSIDELKKITDYCRLYNVKVYFACNILILEHEIEIFAETATPWLELVPDAVILQDIGLATWFKSAAPWAELHASTQMSIASSNAVRLAGEMGFSRCVLARELSIEQIKEIHRDCPKMELEVFVHGALCVSYSGQCNASLCFGGRSANRGDCAQCCRLPYKIFANGEYKEKSYAYSPSDLCAIPVLDELLESGVSSLKIEGRMKSAEYVASATAAYRKALDKGEGFDRKKLETAFSRGFTSGWLKQSETQNAVSGNVRGHIGFLLGQVEKARKNKIWVKTKNECTAGDGVIIASEDKQFGGRVYGVQREAGILCLAFAKDKDFSEANFNFKVYINSSSPIRNANSETRKVPVRVELSGEVGEPLYFRIDDVEVKSNYCLERNLQGFQNLQNIIPSNSVYVCENPILNVSADAFVNDKMVRQLRQQAVEMLSEKRMRRDFLGIKPVSFVWNNRQQKAWQPEDLVLDFLDTKDLQVGIELGREMGFKVGIATWQIHLNSDIKFLENIALMKPDFILVRSLGAFEFLRNKGIELRGDFSLNVCNSMAAAYFLEKGMTSIRSSLDSDKKFFSNIPAFHTKHCLFSAVFAGNKVFPKCGSPCKFSTLEVEDRKGKRHFVLADGGCRNSMFISG